MFERYYSKSGILQEIRVSNGGNFILMKGKIYSSDRKGYFSPSEIKTREALSIYFGGYDTVQERKEILTWCGGVAWYDTLQKIVEEYRNDIRKLDD